MHNSWIIHDFSQRWRRAGSGARNTWTVTVLTRGCHSTGRRRHLPVGRLTRRWVSATTPFLQETWKVVATAIRWRLFIPLTPPLYHRPRPCTMCCGGGGAHGHVPWYLLCLGQRCWPACYGTLSACSNELPTRGTAGVWLVDSVDGCDDVVGHHKGPFKDYGSCKSKRWCRKGGGAHAPSHLLVRTFQSAELRRISGAPAKRCYGCVGKIKNKIVVVNQSQMCYNEISESVYVIVLCSTLLGRYGHKIVFDIKVVVEH